MKTQVPSKHTLKQQQQFEQGNKRSIRDRKFSKFKKKAFQKHLKVWEIKLLTKDKL